MAEVRYILAVVLSAVLFSSCINEEYEGPDPDLPARTILVWLGGDNNLSDETGRKIEALRQGWTLHREQMPDLSGFPRRGAPAAPARGLPDDTDALCGDCPGVRCGEFRFAGDLRPGTAGGCGRISGRQLRADLLLARQRLAPGGDAAKPAKAAETLPLDRRRRRGHGTRRDGDRGVRRGHSRTGCSTSSSSRPASRREWRWLTNCAGRAIICWLPRPRSSPRALLPSIRRRCGCCAIRPWRRGRPSRLSGTLG